MKYVKIGTKELAALAIILLAAAIRLVLIGENWPITNSDEGTMGIMALHIAYHGAHPIYFYGQAYMGAWEAYLGAALFHIFGPSLFTLRLGLVLMFVVFMICMYLLTSLLYSKGQALVTIILLGLGSGYVMACELTVYGGYPDTLCFGTLLFLLAFWLTYSYKPQLSRRQLILRLLAYSSWGFVAGLGLWSDLLIAPFILMSGLLMLIFCWREWLRILAPFGILAGLIIGILPILLYNMRGSQNGSTLSTILGLINGGSAHMTHTFTILLQELQGTIGVSIPMMTGEPFCPVSEVSFAGITSPNSPTCALLHWSWGIAYLLLLLVAFVVACAAAWRALKTYWTRQEKSIHESEYQELVRTIGRLMLLVSSFIALFIYAYSNAPMVWPGYHAHYLIGLLIITPILIAPFWSSVTTYLSKKQQRGITRGTIVSAGSGLVLALIVIFGVVGVFNTFGEVPITAQYYQTQMRLIQDLEHLGVKHDYTAYWTCDMQAFLSNEQIICGVETNQLVPTHNRYMPYFILVAQDPGAAYVILITKADGPPASVHIWSVEQKFKVFHRYIMDGYVIYLPG